MKRKKQLLGYIQFVCPMLLLYVIFFLIPLGETILYSFTDWNGIATTRTFIGIRNYINAFHDPVFYSSLRFTAASAILFMAAANILGFFLALGLNRKIKSKILLRAIIFCPFIFNNVTVGFIWQFLLGRLMTDFYSAVGWSIFQMGWLSNENLVLYSVVFVKLWQAMGYFMVIYLAGLQMLPKEPLEAAVIDGCSQLQMITYIKLPLMKSTVFVCMFLAITETLNMYPLLMTLTNGGPGHASENISLYIYTEAFKSHNMGYASALAVLLTILVLMVGALQMKLTKEE